ncbi:MAG: hypothetical protein FJZ38_18780 [Candidatus Rokubacteria bacterium]|nr:hypothetical protein [Candidatus Rokubacteria bacterium]
MNYIGMPLAGFVLLLAGCAGAIAPGDNVYPAAFSEEAQCERNGGAWRAVHGMCEYQSPGDMR